MKFYLQWNIVNWITVLLMVSIGMLVLGMGASAIRQYAAASNPSADDVAD